MMGLFRKYVGFKITALTVLVALLFMTATVTVQPKKAEAICCSDCCLCLSVIGTDFSAWVQNWLSINLHIFIELWLHRILWFDFEFWQTLMLPAFMQMGNQLAGVGAQQVMAIGMFIDAKEQLETQRLLQVLHAKANKDYHPSIGMCEFGTRMKSLAASERQGEMNALILSERSLDRFLSNKDTGVSGGSKDDIAIRLGAFQTKFCDPFDNDHSLEFVCPQNASAANPGPTRRDRFNKDIDYQRTLEDPWTIGFNLTAGGTPSDTDLEVLALSNNLYGFEGFQAADFKALRNTRKDISDIQKAYIDMRAVVAKTKVAENSFNALVSMKGEGTVGSREFIKAYLEELGVDSGEVDEFLGQNPSYHAQMEILTKKAYQSPQFYTNLYDKPANVERKGVAMQAIGLIQKFDLLKSYLRTEASLSVLLELHVERLQREVEDNIQALGTSLE